MRFREILLLVASLVAFLGLANVSFAQAVFNPTDDGAVRSSSPTANRGTSGVLTVRTSNDETYSFLKFNVTGLTNPVASATLELAVANASNDGGSIFQVSNNSQGTNTPWTEGALIWNNAPLITGQPLSSVGAVAGGQTAVFDVTAAVNGNGIVSFGIKNGSADAVVYRSKQGSIPPRLVVQVAGNLPPVANAGPDQTVFDANDDGSEPVVLDGSASFDPDGTIVSYVWREGETNIATGVSPTVTLAVGVHSILMKVTDNSGASAIDQVVITVNPNQPPVANAGPDQTVPDIGNNGSEIVTLDGTGSFDPDGTIVGYSWSEGGIEIATAVNPSVTLSLGVHTIDLEVTDNAGATGTDQVIVTVAAGNQPPVANAGPDQTLTDSDNNGTEAVVLDGSGSFDPDGTIVSYIWSEGGTSIASGVNPTVTLSVGVHTVELAVTDDAGAASTDQVVITINPGNQPPVANAGPDQTVTDADNNGSEPVTLDGSASFDPDGTIVSYSWNEGGNPVATGATPTVTFAVGVHAIDLTVTDNGGASSTDQVVIAVNAPGNQPPVANAGPDQTLTDTDNNGSEPVTLDGSASSDPDGTIVSYNWAEAGTPLAAGVSPTVTLPVGVHAIDLTVVDDGGASSVDQVVITINPGNQSPTANAGPDQMLADADNNGSEPATLDGSASFDPDGSIVSYSWSEGGNLLATGANPTVTLSVGVHPIDLTVTDNGGATATDQVVVTVTANQPPIANAGPDQTVVDADNNGSEPVTLDGSASVDPDGSIASYVWREGETNIATGVNPTVTLSVGVHSIRLRVVDNGGAASFDNVAITVNPPGVNQPPVANAGPDQTVTDVDNNGTEAATLDGSASLDPDGTIVSYVWFEGETQIATGVGPTVTLALGAHTILLRVTDDAGATALDQVVVIVNQPPVANAGPDQTLIDTDNNLSEPVVLDGSASFDPDGTLIGYSWSEGGIEIATGVTPTVTLAAGFHAVDLTVTDNDSATAVDQVIIRIRRVFSLTMAEFPAGGGSTSPPVGSTTVFPESTVVSISATANPGYVFGYWSGIPPLDAATSNSIVTMDSSKTVVGNFLEQPPAAGETTAASLGLTGALTAYGPLGIFGFPTYYTDSNGLSLMHGVDITDPLMLEYAANPTNPAFDPTLLANPNAPLDVNSGNFFDESFYCSASALMSTGAGKAILVYAGGEAVFFTPNLQVKNGFQTVFNRIRIRVDIPTFPAGQSRTYTVTHPYGVNTFTVATGGPRAINFTVDSATQVGFNSALDGSFVPVNPFLVWTGGQAPAGYVGDPNIDHAVTGSPVNTNFFRIEGPDIGGTGVDIVQTFLFGIAGKILGGTIPPPTNQPPVAYAGQDQTVTDVDTSGAENVTLDGSLSFDVDGTIVGYSWSESGSQIATGVNPTVSFAVGTHLVDLTVTDNNGATGIDQVQITVIAGNLPPIANAGPDQTVTDTDNNGSEPVTLDGSASSDPDGNIASYSWAEAGTEIATGVNPTVTLAVGVHPIDLTVTDNGGAASSDQVVVTVNPSNTFSLTMAVAPANSGTTTPPAGSVTMHMANDVVPITATANTGFVFSNWTGGAVADPNSPSTTVTITGNTVVTANFTPLHILTMAVFPPGSGSTTPAEGSTTSFPQGTVANISATPNPGFVFGYWTGIPPLDAATAGSTVTMDSSKTVTANFLELPPAAGETTAASLGLSGALAAYGPLSIFGFPTYYTDTNGVTLMHGVDITDPLMLEFAANPNNPNFDPTLLANPNAPLDINVGNFFEESFYYSAGALMNTGAGKANLVYAGGEAVFFTPNLQVQNGFQTVFNRIRIRVDIPTFPAGQSRTYVVTHPYGVNSFTLTAGGPRAINLTIDSATQVGFNSALDGTFVPANPFLVWTGGQAPAGYVGDPAVDQTVTGSPFNTNFFKIIGQDIGGVGVDSIQTDLFSVAGKILGTTVKPRRKDAEKAGRVAAGEASLSVPETFALRQNYPNPFNPSTTIAYDLPRDVRVEVTIFNLRGERVQALVNRKQAAGSHSASWNGRDRNGRPVSSGIYLYSIKAGAFVQVRKMTLLK